MRPLLLTLLVAACANPVGHIPIDGGSSDAGAGLRATWTMVRTSPTTVAVTFNVENNTTTPFTIEDRQVRPGDRKDTPTLHLRVEGPTAEITVGRLWLKPPTGIGDSCLSIRSTPIPTVIPPGGTFSSSREVPLSQDPRLTSARLVLLLWPTSGPSQRIVLESKPIR